MIHRILHPNPGPLKVDPDLLNDHFTTTSQRLLESTPNSPHALQELIHSLIVPQAHSTLSPIVKMATDYIASPLTQIINSFISNNIFPAAWKMARVTPIPEVDSPINA